MSILIEVSTGHIASNIIETPNCEESPSAVTGKLICEESPPVVTAQHDLATYTTVDVSRSSTDCDIKSIPLVGLDELADRLKGSNAIAAINRAATERINKILSKCAKHGEGIKIAQVFELMLHEIKIRGFLSRMDPVVTCATDPKRFHSKQWMNFIKKTSRMIRTGWP